MHAFLNCMSLPQIMASKTCSSNGRCWGICYDSNREGRCVLKIGFYLSFMKLLEKRKCILKVVAVCCTIIRKQAKQTRPLDYNTLNTCIMLLLLNIVVHSSSRHTMYHDVTYKCRHYTCKLRAAVNRSLARRTGILITEKLL